MGLAERKLVAAFKEGDYAKFCKDLNEISGTTLNIEFDFTALENDSQCAWIMDAKKYNDFLINPMLEAFRNICGDDMGKSAVKEGVKKIVLVPVSGELEAADGVFTIRSSLAGQGVWQANQIQELFENNL